MAGYALKVKSKAGQNVLKTLTPQSTISELKSQLASTTDINISSLNVLFGFPPKPLDLSKNDASLEQCGIISGETLIVEEKLNQPNTKATVEEEKCIPKRSHIVDTQGIPGILMKQIVPADNSCLFTSIGYVLNGRVDTTVGSYMREIIAQAVKNDPENYNEAILGKPNEAYCDWIRKPESWGGAIELAILSEYYGIEMDVVDTLNAIINRFGEDKKYSNRVFLLFDGIHYDPLYLESLESGDIQTLFPTDDERVFKEAEQLAMEAKSSRQFTDVYKFTLKCLVCNMHMTGQVQAQTHARETGHQNFGEV